ncbi:hypothetical protein [Sulfobacillus thermosulfidooxidans]|uniref:hypothetical protein n=1 Tax=Sulfobacillus thermosulfidooxidans TaxID=28034 RepID=UPI00117EDD11|nr:hypothetical protein [Sulfobacillus thermosulfidooxidans]
MPKCDNFGALTHIEEAVQRIRRWTERISYQEFLDDEIRQRPSYASLTIPPLSGLIADPCGYFSASCWLDPTFPAENYAISWPV